MKTGKRLVHNGQVRFDSVLDTVNGENRSRPYRLVKVFLRFHFLGKQSWWPLKPPRENLVVQHARPGSAFVHVFWVSYVFDTTTTPVETKRNPRSYTGRRYFYWRYWRFSIGIKTKMSKCGAIRSHGSTNIGNGEFTGNGQETRGKREGTIGTVWTCR